MCWCVGVLMCSCHPCIHLPGMPFFGVFMRACARVCVFAVGRDRYVDHEALGRCSYYGGNTISRLRSRVETGIILYTRCNVLHA